MSTEFAKIVGKVVIEACQFCQQPWPWPSILSSFPTCDSCAKKHSRALAQERDSLNRHLDAIAEALHPHKPKFTEERWTYLPDQLPEMVRALRQFVSIQNILIDQQRMADLMQSPAWEEYRAARDALDARIKENR